MPNIFCSNTSQKAQLRATCITLSLQTVWTGFDPNLYSSGSSSAGPALVEIATARSFILDRGIVTDTMSATPLEPGWYAVHSTPPRLLSFEVKFIFIFEITTMETIQRVVKGQRELEYVASFPRLSMHESNLGKGGEPGDILSCEEHHECGQTNHKSNMILLINQSDCYYTL